MKPKVILTAMLLCFVGISIAAMIYKETRAREVATLPAAKESVPVAAEQSPAAPLVVVYYFHGDTRCTTCRAIEEQSHAAITGNFKEALAEGQLEWRLVNFDTPGNTHFRDDFQLSFQSVVLVEERDGKVVRWKNLADVWTKIHETPQQFEQFVIESTTAFIAGEGA
jgi:hypothetical protein